MPKDSKKEIIEAYCVRCSSKNPVEGGKLIDGDRARYAGNCSVCQGKVSVFLSKAVRDKLTKA